MALFSKGPSGFTPSLLSLTPCGAHRRGPSQVGNGEALLAGDACYIKNDGSIWKCVATTTASDASNECHGFATIDYPNLNSPVTLYYDVDLAYGLSSSTPGTPLYLSTTAGRLDTAATSGSPEVVATVDYVRADLGVPSACIHVMKTR